MKTFLYTLVGLFLVETTAVAQRYRPVYEVQALPETINSDGEENRPLLLDNTLYFARTFHVENEGGIAAGQDIWMTSRENGEWSPPTNELGKLNDNFSNVILGRTEDHSGVYLLNSYKYRFTPRISIARAKVAADGSLGQPVDLDIRDIRTGLLVFDAAIYEKEGVIIVSMDHDGSYGEEDLYVILQNQKGQYSEVINLGENINTKGFEMSPFLTADGRRLYFSSNGHGGEGDADIFFVDRLDDTWTNWSEPVNLGPEVNSSGFDAYYSESQNEAFFSSRRNGRDFADIYYLHLVENELIPGTGEVQPESTPEVVEPEPEPEVVDEPEPTPEPEPEVAPEPTEPEPQPEPEPAAMPQARIVYFEFDSNELTQASKNTLRGLMEDWKQRGELVLYLAGHTDNVGSKEYNDDLASRRALAVQEFLKNNGFEKATMVLNSFGESQPSRENTTAENRGKNRRVELYFRSGVRELH